MFTTGFKNTRDIFFFCSRINRRGNIYTATLDRYWDSFFLLLIRKVGNCRKHLFLEINLNGSRFFSLYEMRVFFKIYMYKLT